ncbi:autotransporter domain-containing protein, partial [Candidatus Thioglobus sp.]|nr:autotransporter domain-containing protein [Candidatus Thioglobus sp.]
TYNLGDSEYSSSGKFIFHITTNESDVNINSVKASLPDTSWNANGGSKAVYTLAHLTPAPDTTVPTASLAYTKGGNAVTSVKNGDTVRITATFNEAIADSPVMQISGSGVTTLSATNMTKTSATSYYYDWTVGTGDGTQTFALATGTDVAANVVTATPTSGATIIVDNTAPSISSSATASVAENQTSAIDVDATDAITYSISGTDAASFSINSTSGIVTFNTAPDYETKTSYTFTATATDVAGNTSTQSVTITVTDVDDASPILSFSSPADDSVTFGAGNNIVLTFSEVVDAVSGNITLKKTSDDSTIETFNVASDISGSGSTTITINPAVDLDNSTAYYLQIDASAFDDSSSNSYAGISDTTTLNFTTSSGDTIAPTMAIIATGVSDGSTSDASTLALTFTSNEATTDFVVGDISVGNGTLSSFNAVSSTVYTATLTPAAQGAVTIDVAAGAFTDAAGNDNTAATQFNWTYLSSPLNKTDVTASIKAMSGMAIDTVQMNFTTVDNRIAWLSSNISSNKLSHQGVRLSFANPTIDKLMNTAYVEPGKLSPTNKLLELLRNNLADGTPDTMAMAEDTKAQLNSAAFNEAAKLREETIGKVLNATGGSVMGDWNVWTEGRITVGKTYSTDTTSEQDSQTQNISLGFDRIIKDDNQSLENAGHIVGVVLGIGKSDADTTNNSTVDADSYSISTYGVIRQDDKELVQAQIGYGHIKVDKTRIDGSDTLTGSHNANQFFTSLMVKRETMNVGSFSLSPYGKIQASRTWYDGYSESGGATALTYGEQTIDSTVLSAGVDVDYMIPIHKGNIRPFAKFEYGADVSGSSTVNMHYNNEVTNYQLQLDNKADSNWKFVLGADMYTKEEWDSSISYERTEAVNAGYSDSLAVKVGLKF